MVKTLLGVIIMAQLGWYEIPFEKSSKKNGPILTAAIEKKRPLVVPHGTWRLKTWESVKHAQKDLPLVGVATIQLDKKSRNPVMYWQFASLKETYMGDGLTFRGNRDQDEPLNPLVRIASYNLKIRDCHVINSGGDGLEITGNQIVLDGVQVEYCNRVGIVVRDGLAISLRDCTTEQCDTAGVMVVGGRGGITIENHYAERTPVGVILSGTNSVKLSMAYHSGGIAAWIKDGARNSDVDVTQVKSHVHIERGCIGNVIKYAQRDQQIVKDQDGRNLLVPMLNQWMVTDREPPIELTFHRVPDAEENRNVRLRSKTMQVQRGTLDILASLMQTGSAWVYWSIVDLDTSEQYDFAKRKFVDRSANISPPVDRFKRSFAAQAEIDKSRRVAVNVNATYRGMITIYPVEITCYGFQVGFVAK